MSSRLRAEAEKFPKSDGSRYYERVNKTIGLIADPFLYYDYKDACDLRYLMPDVTESELRELDLLLVASVWHGFHGEWTGAGKAGTGINARLREIEGFCRRVNIPVAYYSKEDPPNFLYFHNLAEDADIIFTSAEELIETYRRDFPGKPVYYLPFAVNVLLYNPIGAFTAREKNAAVFAGSWMPKYPDRVRSQDDIFSWCLQAGLKLNIIDRNYRRNILKYQYPVRYWSHILTDINYDRLGDFYKLHEYVLNFNSVTDSRTMFAKRVYDATACGSVILSNPSVGMERIFPETVTIRSPDDLFNILNEDEESRYCRRMDGIRRCMNGETAYDRICEILSYCGLLYKQPTRKIAVILDPECREPEKVREMFAAQTYPDKILPDAPGDLNLKDFDMLAVWTDKRYYGPRYLEDMANGFKYTRCRYIAKSAFLESGAAFSGINNNFEHNYTEEVRDKYGAVFWRDENWSDDLTRLPESFEASGGYNLDHLDYETAKTDTDGRRLHDGRKKEPVSVADEYI